MASDLQPEDILKKLEKGQLAPFYLFYGPGEFRLEKVLDRVRSDFIPESARDFNLEIYYGGEIDSAKIISCAKMIPFMGKNRLIIVRRIEAFPQDQLDHFLPYFENPSSTTCLIFISSKTDFKKKFYQRIRSSGRAVYFAKLKDNQIVPWLMRTAKEMGLNIEGQACTYLQQIVGNSLRDLYAELIKLQIRNGETPVSMDQVKELAIHSRIYSIFELMDAVSYKDLAGSLSVLNRFLEEEDKISAPLRIIGMLNRQIRLLWQAKSIVDKGGKAKELAGRLNLSFLSAGNLVKQVQHWSVEELRQCLYLLYEVDGLLKSGSRSKPVLENLILALCR
jgi:DNA polymerase-3 subunit delta